MSDSGDQVTDEVVAYLRDGVSVTLVGLPGSGRTRIAGGAADRLREQGCAVVTVRGVAALRDRPLAVLAIAGVDLASPSTALVIPQAVAGLGALLPAGRSALVLDDADDLDSASAGVVAAAQADRGFPVLAVTRLTGRRRSPNQALLDSLRPGVRLRAEPLGFDQVHQLVHALLPGPVDPSAIAQIATLSGGLPGLVRALVDAGRRTGTITPERTVWRARGSLWDARLTQAVEPLLADLDEEEAAALTRLAQAGPTALAEIHDLVPGSLLTRLDASGLVEVVDTPAGALSGVFPPLVAEYLRRSGRTGSRGRAPEARTQRGPLTGALVAVLNMRIVDYWRSEVATLRSAWQSEPTVEHATALLSALNQASAEPEEFEAVLAGTHPRGVDSPEDIHLLGWEALCRGVFRHDPEAARQLLARRREVAPQFATRLRSSEARLCLAVGILPDDALLAPAGAAEEEDPVWSEILDMARRTVLVYAGQTADALAGLPAAASSLADYPEPVRGMVMLDRVFHGDLDTGIAWALGAMAEAVDRLDAGQILECAYVAGIGLVFAGRTEEAQALLDPVLALAGPTMIHEYYHAGVLGLAALNAGWRGQRDYSAKLTAQAETLGRRSGPFPEILRPDDPAVWAVTAERLATGHVAAGLVLAVEAAEVCPDPAGVRAAADHARETQSPFLAALGGYVEAVAAADPDGLAACVSHLSGLGATLYAVKAGVTRALVLRARGDLNGSIRQAEAAWEQAGTRGPVPVGLFFPLGRALGLTGREREIALQLADGATSHTIAVTLGLSDRTVETYLSSAYHKLGSTGRADLYRAVTTWARTGSGTDG